MGWVSWDSQTTSGVSGGVCIVTSIFPAFKSMDGVLAASGDGAEGGVTSGASTVGIFLTEGASAPFMSPAALYLELEWEAVFE